MKIKTMVMAGIASLGLGLAVFAAPIYAVTCPEGSLHEHEEANTLAECNLTGENDLMPTIVDIIEVVIGVLGIVTVAMIILGGVQYVTSSGDSAKTKKAKDTILYGVIGLVIAVLAFAIVNFVATSISNSSPEGTGGSGGSGETTVQQH